MVTSSSDPPLERGKACLRCRGRKMRCDGIRPTCGQCTRAEVDECEYTDAGPTPSQILEQNIAQLEARIREIVEGRPVGPITLHNPHSVTSHTAPPTSPRMLTNIPQPSSPAAQDILGSFISVCADLGFFLNMPRFLDKLQVSMPPSDISPIPPALVYAVQLIGLLFHKDPSAIVMQEQTLPLVLKHLSCDLQPERILYMLQAEVLFAYYLFHKDRRLEGSYHVAAAVSIAVACNLHKLQSAHTSMAGTDIALRPPADAIEGGERINAFWTVFFLDRCWSVWMQSPSVYIREGCVATQIDTPWPMNVSVYEQNMMPENKNGAQTIQCFLEGRAPDSPYQNLLAIRAKAAVLYEKSANFSNDHFPGTPDYQTRFTALDSRIERFKATLPSLEQTDLDRPEIQRDLLVIHTLAYCATVQLHATCGQQWNLPNNKALLAARTAAGLLQSVNMRRLVYVDPILGVLWGIVGNTLISGMHALQSSSMSNLAPGAYALPGEMFITSALSHMFIALGTLSVNCPLIDHELKRLRAAEAGNSDPLVVETH